VEKRSVLEVRVPNRESREQAEERRDDPKPQERLIDRSQARQSLEVRVQPKDLRELRGNLKSPDTERKRKNVSWCEANESEGNVEAQSAQKSSKVDSPTEEYESMRRIVLTEGLNGKDKEKERSRTAIKPREKAEEKYRAEAVKVQRAPSVTVVTREETPYEKYRRSPMESTQSMNERTEERNVERVEILKGTGDKERLMEEKRKKIDEEIERRISKQIELKKRADVAVEGQKKIYEKASQIEDDFKISPYSTEKSRDKEVVSRLVREKQMRNDLISKYSETPVDESARRSKSPLMK